MSDTLCKLQKGHIDAARPLEAGNIVPLCQYCNQTYKDDVVFNTKGRIVAVASPALVLRASQKVQKRVFRALQDKFMPKE